LFGSEEILTTLYRTLTQDARKTANSIKRLEEELGTTPLLELRKRLYLKDKLEEEKMKLSDIEELKRIFPFCEQIYEELKTKGGSPRLWRF
jgi:hypothetical protein